MQKAIVKFTVNQLLCAIYLQTNVSQAEFEEDLCACVC